MLAQRIRNICKVHLSILKKNLLLIFLRSEKSTPIVNLAITHELPQQKGKIRGKPGFLLVNGDPIRQSVTYMAVKTKKVFV